MLLVRFKPGIVLSYADGPGSQLHHSVSPDWTTFAAAYPGVTLTRARRDDTSIHALIAHATSLDASYQPPDLWSSFVVLLPAGVSEYAAAADLRAWSSVRFAASIQRGQLPWSMPTRDPLFAKDGAWAGQIHLGPAKPWPAKPLIGLAWTAGFPGIDAFEAWRRPGGDGAGVNFADVERGWMLPDAEISGLSDAIDPVSGKLSEEATAKAHGRAVLGIVAAKANGDLTVGIAPAVSNTFVASTLSEDGVDENPYARAVTDASAAVGIGGVVLIEETVGTDLPLEWDPDVFDAISVAVAAGRVVVEASGNIGGGNDLDLAAYADGFEPFNLALQDSGAVVVGGVMPIASLPESSNTGRGSRIDCFAWDQEVQTLGASGNSFGGTSAAAAIVAGIAVAMQGMQIAQTGSPLSPGALRDILRNSTSEGCGSDVDYFDPPSAPPPGWTPRGMPDLRKICRKAMALADPYLRDNTFDSGAPSLVYRMGASPDLAAEPLTSGTAVPAGPADDRAPGVSVKGGAYRFGARVWNRGKGVAEGVVVDLYHAELAPMVPPFTWVPIGRQEFASIAPSGSAVAPPVAAVVPTAAAERVSVSLVGVVGTAAVPPPSVAQMSGSLDFQWASRVLAKVAWRSTVRVDHTIFVPTPVGDAMPVPFAIFGAPGVSMTFRLLAGGTIFQVAQVWLEGDLSLPAKLMVKPADVLVPVASAKAYVKVHAGSVLSPALGMAASERIGVRLLVVPNPVAPAKKILNFRIDQFVDKHSVGTLHMIF